MLDHCPIPISDASYSGVAAQNMPARHDWLLLSDAAWQDCIERVKTSASMSTTTARNATTTHATTIATTTAALMRWRDAGWPVVVRRQDADISSRQDLVCAGIALPHIRHEYLQNSSEPSSAKGKRFSLRGAADEIVEQRAPLTLAEVIPSAPSVWREQLTSLAKVASQHQFVLQVYGSLAFQHITGNTYLHADSDIDLLLRIEHRSQLNCGLRLLAEFSQHLPLDGEFVLPDQSALAWKEWWMLQQSHRPSNQQARVLVKDRWQVRLCTQAEVLAKLA